MNFLELSQQFLLAVRTHQEEERYIKQYKEINLEELSSFLDTDARRLPFWINTYNAFSIYFLRQNNGDLKDKQFRREYFNKKQIHIGGCKVSLNLIEHGVLRRSKVWWSLGFIPKFRISKIERKFRVDQLDYRIHFALNCGGKSCPPIRFYEEDGLEAQLELATEAFLESESSYDTSTNEVTTSRLLLWYLKDFNGKNGVIKALKRYNVIPSDAAPSVKYLDYNWHLDLTNFD